MRKDLTIYVEEKPDGYYSVCEVPGDQCLYRGGPYQTVQEANEKAELMVEIVRESMGELIKRVTVVR